MNKKSLNRYKITKEYKEEFKNGDTSGLVRAYLFKLFFLLYYTDVGIKGSANGKSTRSFVNYTLSYFIHSIFIQLSSERKKRNPNKKTLKLLQRELISIRLTKEKINIETNKLKNIFDRHKGDL